MIPAKSDIGNPVSIKLLVLSRSLQCGIGRNVILVCDIVHVDGNKLLCPKCNGVKDPLLRLDSTKHSFLPLSCFSFPRCCIRALLEDGAVAASVTPTFNWDETVRVLIKVCRYVCGHVSFGDICALQRNQTWTNEIRKYLAQRNDIFPHCVAAASPQHSRKVSLSTLNRSFNDDVCVDYFYLDSFRLFHIMDVYSQIIGYEFGRRNASYSYYAAPM